MDAGPALIWVELGLVVGDATDVEPWGGSGMCAESIRSLTESNCDIDGCKILQLQIYSRKSENR